MTESLLQSLKSIPDRGQFVILEHTVPVGGDRSDHWDVMLESPNGLLTWASPPFPAGILKWEVTPLPVHRAMYLDYEGPISGNRGYVRRFDRGEFRTQDRQLRAVMLECVGHVLQGQMLFEVHPNGRVWISWNAVS